MDKNKYKPAADKKTPDNIPDIMHRNLAQSMDEEFGSELEGGVVKRNTAGIQTDSTKKDKYNK